MSVWKSPLSSSCMLETSRWRSFLVPAICLILPTYILLEYLLMILSFIGSYWDLFRDALLLKNIRVLPQTIKSGSIPMAFPRAIRSCPVETTSRPATWQGMGCVLAARC